MREVPAFPPVVRIEPAGACNLACAHCPTGTIEMKRGIMRPRVFDCVAAEVAQHRGDVRVAVLYHGGEPLLNKRFHLWAAALKQAGVPLVKTVSNGMLLTAETADRLIDSGLDAIEVSLDAESPAENDAVRRGADFELIAGNVRGLIDRIRARGSGLLVQLSTTQFLNVGVDDPAVRPEPPRYLLDAFDGYIDGSRVKATWAMQWPHMEVLPQFELWTDPTSRWRRECDYTVATATVRWNGDVVACCYDLTSQLVLGNVCDQSLAEIWQSEPYRQLRAGIASGDYPDLCRSCNVVRPEVYLKRRVPLAATG